MSNSKLLDNLKDRLQAAEEAEKSPEEPNPWDETDEERHFVLDDEEDECDCEDLDDMEEYNECEDIGCEAYYPI